jgi:MFS family permease
MMQKELKNLFVTRALLGLVAGYLLIGLPIYLSDLKIGIDNIGIICGLSTISYALISFYIGSNSEYFGRKQFGIISIIGILASIILFGILPLISLGVALVLFVISKLLLDTSENVLTNISKIRVLDVTSKERLGRAYGVFILADSLGIGFGMLLGAGLLSLFNFQITLIFLAMLILAGLIFFLRSGDITVQKKKQKVLILKDLWNTSRLFKIVLIMNTVLIFGGIIVDSFGLPLYQKQVLNMPNEQIFLVLGIAWVCYGAFNSLGGKLYDKYGPSIFMVSMFLTAITSILLAYIRDILLFSLLLILDYILFAFADPARWAITGAVSMENKGQLMSYFTLAAGIVAGLAMLFLGRLLTIFSFESIFILRGLLELAGIILLVWIYQDVKKLKVSEQSD